MRNIDGVLMHFKENANHTLTKLNPLQLLPFVHDFGVCFCVLNFHVICQYTMEVSASNQSVNCLLSPKLGVYLKEKHLLYTVFRMCQK